MTVIAALALGYGLVMTLSASVGYWQKLMRRGPFGAMTLGGALLGLGTLLYAGGMTTGIGLSALGLYCISDGAFVVGLQKQAGPRPSHHLARAALAALLLLAMIATR